MVTVNGFGRSRQVAFAKGEATRMGLDATKEQLPARWQAGGRSGG